MILWVELRYRQVRVQKRNWYWSQDGSEESRPGSVFDSDEDRTGACGNTKCEDLEQSHAAGAYPS